MALSAMRGGAVRMNIQLMDKWQFLDLMFAFFAAAWAILLTGMLFIWGLVKAEEWVDGHKKHMLGADGPEKDA